VSDSRIERIVEAISDREHVDWDSVRRQFADGTGGEHCAHLETVSKIGHVAHNRDAAHQDVREPAWVSILLALAIVQIALGILGSVAYRPYSFVNGLRFLTILSFAGVGIALRQNRHNPRARDLGAVFLFNALGPGHIPYGLFVDKWFSGSMFFGVLRDGLALDAWAPYFFWQFARRFPSTVRFTRVDRIAIVFTKVAGIAGAALFALNLWAAISQTRSGIAWTFSLAQPGQRYYSAAIFALMLPALPIIYMRARSAAADERARVRLFAIGMVAGIAPPYIEVMLEALFPAYLALLDRSAEFRVAVVTMVILPWLALPFVTSYSVLVHRLLDVSFVIKQGVRYLLARWTLVVLTLAPFGLFAADVYNHRADSVVSIVSNRRGAILVALIAAGCVLLASRTALMRALDRWFDRRGIDRATVLARSADALRLVRTRSELVDSIVEAAETALNASAVVYFLNPLRQAYVPFGRGGLSLPCDSALATIMMNEPTLSALRTEGEHSLARFLPRAERVWLAETNACLLAPIRSQGVERPAGLIVFGSPRDALGYVHDDERFVTALASAVGISLENLRLKSEAVGEIDEDGFGMVCRRCHRVTDSVEGQLSCTCGGELRAASIPRRINNKFQVDALLGAGGMGVAYLATDLALSRSVAIKTLPSVSADALARLGREARTMAALSHPNLATILGLESWRGTPILVCEFLPGGTLQQRLLRGPLDIDEAFSLGLALLDALEYMHGQGVLHRDIKPSNIAFTAEGAPKLLDFGLAGLLERADPTAQAEGFGVTMLTTNLAGTLAYLPPQAFQGEAPTIRFDLWGLAVVLFEAIVGRHPFAAGVDTVHNICRGLFVASFDERPDVPPAARAFLRTALSPSIHGQFNSTSVMRQALITARVAVSPRR
jgi:Protein kinase domain